MSEDYNLTESCQAIGKLVPILKDAHGNIIDGFHRIESDPKWNTITVESVDNPVKLELARLAVNFCRRRMTETEMKQRISFLIGAGMKAEEIADKTGISKTTIYKYMPQGFKNEKISEGTKAGKQKTKNLPSAEVNREIQDIAQEEKFAETRPSDPTLSTLAHIKLSEPKEQNQNGRQATPTEYLKTIECPYCHKRFIPEEV